MPVALQEPEVNEQNVQATNRALSTLLGPPYDGIWTRPITNRNVFWSAQRHRPLQGEVVAQMGTHSANHPTAYDRLEIGLMKRFVAPTTGRYRFVFEVTTGPITRIGPAATSMIAFSSAGGFDSENLPASRQPYTRHLSFAVDVESNTMVRLYCSSRVVCFVRPGTTAYGEVIASIAKITAFRLPYAAENDETRESALRGLLEESGDLDAAVRSLSETHPEQELVDQELSLAEAYRIGEQTFTSLGGADA